MYEIAVHSDVTAFDLLGPSWTELLARSPGQSLSQSLAWCRNGWRLAAQPGDRLCIVTAAGADGLAGLWPLYVRRERGVRIARQLGCGSNEEYGGPFCGPDTGPVYAALLAAALAETDVLHVCNLRQDGPLAALIDSGRSRHARQLIASPIVGLKAMASLDTWLAGKSRSFRQEIRAAGRALARTGPVALTTVTAEDATEVAEWFVAAKLRWLDSRNIGQNWLRAPHVAGFFAAVIADPASGARGHVLRVGDRIIAASVSLFGDTVEYFVTTYDPAFAKFSPGGLLLQGIVAEAIAVGSDLDFRITHDGWKLRWTDYFEQRATYLIAGTPRGLPMVVVGQLRLSVKQARRHAGALLRKAGRRG